MCLLMVLFFEEVIYEFFHLCKETFFGALNVVCRLSALLRLF